MIRHHRQIQSDDESDSAELLKYSRHLRLSRSRVARKRKQREKHISLRACIMNQVLRGRDSAAPHKRSRQSSMAVDGQACRFASNLKKI